MDIDRAFRNVVLTVVALFAALWLWASSFSGGDSGVSIVASFVTYLFCSLAGPLCIFGALVGLFVKQGVKLGLIFGLTSALGLTGLVMLRILFFH